VGNCSTRPVAIPNARERINTTIVTVVKGNVSSKQIEEEFARILPRLWRWTIRKISDNQFTVRFPNVQLIKDWSRFNPVKMRTAKTKLQIDTWNGFIGAKAELQMAWFRIRGIPFNKRSEETDGYAGSLVGATTVVDKTTLSRTDYVRVKVAAKDITKIPAEAEGAILPYLYGFHYEREVDVEEVNPEVHVMVVADQGTSASMAK
jgi:hypothetical protein